MQKRSFIILCLALLSLPSCDSPDSGIVVESRPNDPVLRLSEVKFRQVEAQGTPHQIVDQLNDAMRRAGFKAGLRLEGDLRKEGTQLSLQQVTYREVMDQICLQLKLSYWDNDKRGALHLQGGLTSSFDVYMRDELGMFKPAGPRATAPPGYDLLPLRSEYFNRKIQDLEAALSNAPE